MTGEMMRADYDSEADALEIELVRFERLEGQDSVDDTYCQVGFAGGRPQALSCSFPLSTSTCSRSALGWPRSGSGIVRLGSPR
jgi:hypothetical protein